MTQTPDTVTQTLNQIMQQADDNFGIRNKSMGMHLEFTHDAEKGVYRSNSVNIKVANAFLSTLNTILPLSEPAPTLYQDSASERVRASSNLLHQRFHIEIPEAMLANDVAIAALNAHAGEFKAAHTDALNPRISGDVSQALSMAH